MLKNIFAISSDKYKQILGFATVWWLSLLVALERMLELFPLLKSFFISENQCEISKGVMCMRCVIRLVQTGNIYQILAG